MLLNRSSADLGCAELPAQTAARLSVWEQCPDDQPHFYPAFFGRYAGVRTMFVAR